MTSSLLFALLASVGQGGSSPVSGMPEAEKAPISGLVALGLALPAPPGDGMRAAPQGSSLGDVPARPAGEILYADDFSDPDSGWPTVDNEWGRSGYAGGRYFIEPHLVMGRATFQIVAGRGSPTVISGAIEVEARAEQRSEELSYGIGFDLLGPDKYYTFDVNPAFGAFKVSKQTSSGWVRLLDWTQSSAIERDQATNLLRVELMESGREAHFFVNGEQVGEITVTDRFQGAAGLVASSDGARASFDNFVIERLGEDVVPTPTVEGGTPTDAPPCPPAESPVIFRDCFDDPGSGWPQNNAGTRRFDYLDGEYQVAVTDDTVAVANGPLVTDAAIQFDARMMSMAPGGPLRIGLLFAVEPEMGSYYIFQTDPPAGNFAVLRRVGGQYMLQRSWAAAPSLRTGQQTNTLRVERSGDRVRLMINGSTVFETRVAAMAAGQGGLLVSGNGEARFDNFLVETLEGLPRTPTAEPSDVPAWPTLPVQPTSPRPTPEPTSGTVPPTDTVTRHDLHGIHLPLALRVSGHRVGWWHPTPVPWQVEVSYGTAIDDDGELVGAGRSFAFGTRRLVGRIRHTGVPAGTLLRWAWRHAGTRLEAAGLAGTVLVTEADGAIDRAIVRSDGGPLPPGSYELMFAVGEAGPLAVHGAARIEPDEVGRLARDRTVEVRFPRLDSRRVGPSRSSTFWRLR